MDFPSLYGYLECLEVSPCMGWMSSNETLRMVTTDHAVKLSNVAKNIAETENYDHFNMIYYDFDIRPSIELWVSYTMHLFKGGGYYSTHLFFNMKKLYFFLHEKLAFLTLIFFYLKFLTFFYAIFLST